MQTSTPGWSWWNTLFPDTAWPAKALKSLLLTPWYLSRKLTICVRACVLLMHAYACTCNLPLCPRRLSKSIMCHFTKSGFPLIAPKCTKCAVAFHRWPSRAEQPCAKLCPVQSAEVKLIEMNTFCNYAHIGNTVGTAAKQSRCGLLVGASKFTLSTNETEKHYWKSFLFILTEPPFSKSSDLIALDCFSYIFCFVLFFAMSSQLQNQANVIHIIPHH